MKKLKYYIDADEVYPVYKIISIKRAKDYCSYYKKTVPLAKIPLDKLQWIRQVEKEYLKMQKYLIKMAQQTSRETWGI